MTFAVWAAEALRTKCDRNRLARHRVVAQPARRIITNEIADCAPALVAGYRGLRRLNLEQQLLLMDELGR
jgi:hypothetical protein